MNLEWMHEHRDLVAKLIRFANAYTVMYNRPVKYGTEIELTASQIQTLEYIMENENVNMTTIAEMLGVTRSTFSKNAQKLFEKGYIEKFHRDDNKKDVFLFATDLGKDIYKQYTDYVYTNWYQHMFSLADEIPKEYLEKMKEIIDWYTYTLIKAGNVDDKVPVYTKIDS